MKPFKEIKQYFFVLLPEVLYKQETSGPNVGKMVPAMGTFSFRDYTDKTNALGKGSGISVQYVISKDARGRDRGKFFTLSQSHNAFMVNDTDTDLYGVRMYDFIANSPFCEGSPNGNYRRDENGDLIQVNIMFRLMNSEADAEVALEADIRRSKAQLSAAEIDEQTLLEVATIGLGRTGDPDKVMRHAVVQWAGKRPQDYFDILDSGDRPIKSAIRRALSDRIFEQKGSLIYWGQTLIGADEDTAVATLMKDEQLLNALKEKVNIRSADKPKPKVVKKK